VRKNVASRHAGRLPNSAPGDPWQQLFDAAVAARDPEDNDLQPYWIYPLQDGASIERHVPALPLSRDVQRMAALRRSLVVYRMVFGQPRQEDLLAHLLGSMPREDLVQHLAELQIDLLPS
jgi:hypothetical protein